MTGRINQYGTEPRRTRLHVRGRRRRGPERGASAAYAVPGAGLLDTELRIRFGHGYGWFRVDAIARLADELAALMLDFPVRTRARMVRRIFAFSTSTQCGAVGTNQLRAAARSFTLVPSRLVAFGMLPFACSAFSDAVLVKILIQSFASVFWSLVAGIARSEPPRKPGIVRPFVWLGITNWPVTSLNLPTQQLNHAGPSIDAACPCAYTSYGFGRV